MTERIVTETYSRETRRNLYDQKDKEPKHDTTGKVPNVETDELKKAIADLATKISDIKEGNKKVNEEKSLVKKENKEKRDKEMVNLLESQKAIQDQLEEQKSMLKKIDTARQESDRVLRDDVSEALTEHKHLTDEALHHLAVKVSDLVSDNIALRKMVEEMRKTLESVFVDDSDEEIKKVQTSRSSSRSSLASSGSVAVELPPAIVTDGRRPSQAYHMHTLALAEELADTSAKKALEEATRINVSRM